MSNLRSDLHKELLKRLSFLNSKTAVNEVQCSSMIINWKDR